MSELLRSSVYLSQVNPHLSSNLDDILKCVICYEKLSDPKMCPFCSKLCCKLCIHRWLIENRSHCPHCRAGLRLDQLVTCRFLNDITQALENLSATRPDPIEKCSNHSCPLSYYCLDCSSAVCSDCAMFSAEHKGHEFQHLTNIYKQHVEQIQIESKVMNKRLKDLEIMLVEVDVKIEKFRNAKEEKSRELIACMEQIQGRLDIQLKDKLQVLNRSREEIYQEIRNLKILQNELEKELGQSAKSRLIAKSADLVKKLKNIQNLPLSKFEESIVSSEFQSEIVPSYDSGIFILKNYSSMQNNKEVVYSDVLSANGLMWRLKVYPNGNGVAKSNYLSVFLELLKGYGETATYDYRVEMVNHIDNSLCVVREFASDFETGECWGYNRFYRIDLLRDEGYLGADDTLIMRFYVRATTFYQLQKDQKNFIKSLLDKEAAAKAQVQTLIKKLEKYGDRISDDDCDSDEKEKEAEISFKEEVKRGEDEVLKEMAANSPNELSTMMQKYIMSPEEVSSDGEILPKQLIWNELQDIPDFHSCSELMSQDFLDFAEDEEKEFSPLG